MSKTLRWYHHKYERILQSNLTDNQKSREYANLMTEMEHEFEIPILKNEEWEKKNKAVIALYRKISMSRSLKE